MSSLGSAAHGAFMRRDDRGDRARLAGIAVAVLLHIVAFAALWRDAPIREAISAVIPVTVTFITPPAPEPPAVVKPPVVPPVRPRTTPMPPPIEAPALTTTTPEAPAQSVAPPSPPEPSPPSVPAPEITAAPVAAIAPPRFDADYLQNPAPAYPGMSRRNGEQGKVLLHVLVGADGRAQRVELRTSSNFERLDNAALDTVAQWRFVPARQGDRAVAGWVLIPISFALKG